MNDWLIGRVIHWLADWLMVLDSPIFDDAINPRRLTSPVRSDAGELTVRWSRSPAISTLSLGGWDMAGSRITLLSHASSSAAETGSGNDVTPSPTSDFRCLQTPELVTPSTDGDNASSDNEADANETFSVERKRKRKWNRRLMAAATNPVNRQQSYQRLDDDEWLWNKLSLFNIL